MTKNPIIALLGLAFGLLPIASDAELIVGARGSYASDRPLGAKTVLARSSGAVSDRRFEPTQGHVWDRDQRVFWTIEDNGEPINWTLASAYCASLGREWDLPSRAELHSLHDASGTFATRVGPWTVRPVSVQIKLTGFWFWSNERDESGDAFWVHLGNGGVFSNPISVDHYESRALCVRRPRFFEEKSGIWDNEQRVIWAKQDNGEHVQWEQASAYCASLGPRWRLPRVVELLSLYDATGTFEKNVSTGRIRPVTPLIAFSGSTFWSSDPGNASHLHHWSVSMAWGTHNEIRYAGASGRALCVRRP